MVASGRTARSAESRHPRQHRKTCTKYYSSRKINIKKPKKKKKTAKRTIHHAKKNLNPLPGIYICILYAQSKNKIIHRQNRRLLSTTSFAPGALQIVFYSIFFNLELIAPAPSLVGTQIWGAQNYRRGCYHPSLLRCARLELRSRVGLGTFSLRRLSLAELCIYPRNEVGTLGSWDIFCRELPYPNGASNPYSDKVRVSSFEGTYETTGRPQCVHAQAQTTTCRAVHVYFRPVEMHITVLSA